MIPYCMNCQGAHPYHYEVRRKQLVCVCDFCGSEISHWPTNDKERFPVLYCRNWFDRMKLAQKFNNYIKLHGWLSLD